MELTIKVSSTSELASLLPLVQNDSANKKLDLIMSKITDLLAKDQELVKDVNTLLDVNTQQNALIAQLNVTVRIVLCLMKIKLLLIPL